MRPGRAEDPNRDLQHVRGTARHCAQLRTGSELLCEQARQPAGLHLRSDIDRRVLVWFGAPAARGESMNNGHTVLLIEDNPGDADLVRLRLVEGASAVNVSCVTRLADGLASMAKEPPSVVFLGLNP